MKGYIKLFRNVAENRLWYSEPFNRAQIWVDLLILAAHKEVSLLSRDRKIELKRGELAYPVVALARRWKRSRGYTIRVLGEFTREGMIEVRAGRPVTIIRIINWDKYQYTGEEAEQMADQQAEQRTGPLRIQPQSEDQGVMKPQDACVNTGSVQQDEGGSGHIQECLKEQEEGPESVASGLAAHLFSLIRRNIPQARQPDLRRWSRHIRLMLTRDGLSPSDIMRAIEFSQGDPFWRMNILSAEKLRLQYGRLCLEMKRAESKSKPLLPATGRILL
ncbi:MAG: hypothetical protein ACM3S2_07785 [Ignavibacteriales bacterium]